MTVVEVETIVTAAVATATTTTTTIIIPAIIRLIPVLIVDLLTIEWHDVNNVMVVEEEAVAVVVPMTMMIFPWHPAWIKMSSR